MPAGVVYGTGVPDSGRVPWCTGGVSGYCTAYPALPCPVYTSTPPAPARLLLPLLVDGRCRRRQPGLRRTWEAWVEPPRGQKRPERSGRKGGFSREGPGAKGRNRAKIGRIPGFPGLLEAWARFPRRKPDSVLLEVLRAREAKNSHFLSLLLTFADTLCKRTENHTLRTFLTTRGRGVLRKDEKRRNRAWTKVALLAPWTTTFVTFINFRQFCPESRKRSTFVTF